MPAWAGLWDGWYSQPYASISQRMTLQRRVGMAYSREGMAVLQAVNNAINGVAPGANATATRQQVEAVQSVGGLGLGGKRNIVAKTLVNRATTAADVTAQNALFFAKFAPTTYPTDKGGGGGGKTGTL
jgi:hypothetical protein